MKKILIVGLLLVLFCAAGSAEVPVAKAPALSWAVLDKRMRGLESQVPAKPAAGPQVAEWENLNLYLRQAEFVRWRTLPSEATMAFLEGKLRNAEQALTRCRTNGVPPLVTGTRVEGYLSENDGSFQPFIRILPSAAKKGAALPLIVYLHGYAPGLNIVNWSAVPNSLTEFAEEAGFAVAVPFARSNTDFQGIGEQDVLRVIAEMQKRYRIDADRIVLAGISMGGMGVWTMGAHYPDLFAGLLVVAGRGDYYFWHGVDRQDVPAYKRRLINAEFAFSLLPNLQQSSVFCLHGDSDRLIPVEEARHMIKALSAINPGLRYVELKDADHWIFDRAFARSDVRTWLKQQRRAPRREFSYVSYDDRFSGCGWATLVGLRRSPKPYSIKVTVAPKHISIAAFGADVLMVYRDAMPEDIKTLPIRCTTMRVVEASGRPGPKGPVPRGPIKNAFLSSFVFVATSEAAAKDPESSVGRAAAAWKAYAKAPPRVTVEGREDIAAALARHNVFLFGEPENSALIREVLRTSPVNVEADAYRVGANRVPRKGNGIWVVRPSPWNPERVAVVQCGEPWGQGLESNHPYDFLPDYIVYRPDADADGSNHALCAGFFDSQWRVKPALMTLRTPTVGAPRKEVLPSDRGHSVLP